MPTVIARDSVIGPPPVQRGTMKLWGPPGAGKTHSLIQSSRQMLALPGADPSELGYIAFTRAAAEEAQQRIAAELDLDPREVPWARTIHSLARRALGADLDAKVVPKQLKVFAAQQGLSYRPDRRHADDDDDPYLRSRQDDNELGDVLAYWEWYQSTLQVEQRRGLGAAYAYYPGRRDGLDAYNDVRNAERVVPAYQAWMEAEGRWDFALLLSRLAASPWSLPTLPSLIVDEAQDLSPALWRIVEQLAARAERVVLAGDPHQAIYGFQGARAEAFLRYPGALYHLPQSYRLSAELVRWCRDIISNSPDYQPFPWEGRGQLERPPLREASIFYLARTRKLAAGMAWAAMDRGEPFSHIAFPDPLATDGPAAPIAALLELQRVGSCSGRSLLAALELMVSTGPSLNRWCWFGAKAALKKRLDLLPFGSRVSRAEAIGRRESGAYLTPLFGQSLDADDPYRALGKVHPRDQDYYRLLVRQHGPQALVETPRGHISTIHGVKGREADYVVLSTDWGTRPYRALISGDLEEQAGEWRTAYVGASRARHNVLLLQGGRRQIGLPSWPYHFDGLGD